MIVELNQNNIDIIKNSMLNEKEVSSSYKNNPFAKYLVYVCDNDVVGYLYYSDIYDRIEINQITVFENYRRKGYASKMMEYLIRKNKPITLEVKCSNNPAINLYKKYGFQQVSIRKGYYNGIDGILMSLEMK